MGPRAQCADRTQPAEPPADPPRRLFPIGAARGSTTTSPLTARRGRPAARHRDARRRRRRGRRPRAQGGARLPHREALEYRHRDAPAGQIAWELEQPRRRVRTSRPRDATSFEITVLARRLEPALDFAEVVPPAFPTEVVRCATNSPTPPAAQGRGAGQRHGRHFIFARTSRTRPLIGTTASVEIGPRRRRASLPRALCSTPRR